jgi:D-alanine-D-alanine ligase
MRVGVAFGGRSVEHDVSIITGLQALEVLTERHEPVPIYIARSGRWYTGGELKDLDSYRSGPDPDAQEINFDLHRGKLMTAAEGSFLKGRKAAELELDAVVIATHGTQGEDGCLQGALELAQLPYAGPPVGAAAAAMDKVTTKAILAAAGLAKVEHMALRREQFERDPTTVQRRVIEKLGLPVYVKPASLGSSVGVSRCGSEDELAQALTLGFELDRVCLIERAVEGGIEINCAVLGRPGAEPRASVCEQPLPETEFLSFEDKYMKGEKDEGMKGSQRLIPAPIDPVLTERIQGLAKDAFTAFGCAGVTRVDFLLDADSNVYVNELNTVPGSFSFYLWEPAGLPFVALMDELLELALQEHSEKLRTTTVFETNLLADRAQGAKT